MAGFRLAIAGFIVLAFAKAKLKIRLNPEQSEFSLIGVLAFLMFANFALHFIGLSYTTSIKGSILSSVGILFVAIFSHFMFKSDKLNMKKTIGLLCGFAGVVMANITIFSQAAFTFKLAGEGLVILHAVLSAIITVLVKKHTRCIDVVRVNEWMLLFGGGLLLCVGFVGSPHIPAFNALSAILLVYTGAVSAVAYTFWFVLLRYHKATEVVQYKFAVPLFGSLLSVIFIPGEHMVIEMLGAAALVAAGIFIVNKQNGMMKQVEQSR